VEQFVALYDGDAQSIVDTVNALTASADAKPLMTPFLLDDARCSRLAPNARPRGE
jgi:hypothetical protein